MEKDYFKKPIELKVKECKEEILQTLPNIEKLTNDEIKNIIKKYTAVFYPSFIVWMTAIKNSVKTEEAKYATGINVFDEIYENHQMMLLNFVRPIDCYPTISDSNACIVPAGIIWDNLAEYMKQKNGIYGLTIMTMLENTSSVFIPWLKSAARKLGNTDETYCDVHGEADIEHADQFLNALAKEYELEICIFENCGSMVPEKIFNHGMYDTISLLKKIFSL